MTEAQEIYVNTPQRDFAINFKNWDSVLKEELNLIHSIQVTAHKIAFYSKSPTEHWKDQGKKQHEQHLLDLIDEYELCYGKYEIETTHEV